MIAVVIGGRRSIRALADYVLHDQATAADPRPVSSERVEWTACLGVPLARRHPGDQRATGDGFQGFCHGGAFLERLDYAAANCSWYSLAFSAAYESQPLGPALVVFDVHVPTGQPVQRRHLAMGRPVRNSSRRPRRTARAPREAEATASSAGLGLISRAPTSMKGRSKTLMTDGSPRWRSLQIHVVSGSDLMMGMGTWSHTSASRPSQPARARSLSHRSRSVSTSTISPGLIIVAMPG